MSPGGKYLLYFDETTGHWFTYRVADGARVNLTEKLHGEASSRRPRHAGSAPAPTASAGWTADDKSVLLYDQYDIWEVKPDGTRRAQ